MNSVYLNIIDGDLMKKELIPKSIIYSSLRRTLKRGLLSSIDLDTFFSLSLKYFGVYENGKFVGYQCPYSGKIADEIVLEHIIPVSLGGGTTLFNCIPTSYEVNGSGEKSNKHLISWWINSKYWDDDAPKRLEKIVKYILDAYEITLMQKDAKCNFSSDFGDIISIDNMYIHNADLTTTQEKEQSVENDKLVSYYTFINDMLDELNKYTDISEYQSKLRELNNLKFFGNVERQTRIQNILKKIIKKKLKVEDRSELGIVLKINILSLNKSLEKFLDDSEISFELERRINNIESILEKNSLSLFSFFQSSDSLSYLSISELSDNDIRQLVDGIEIYIPDKFRCLIDYVEKNGKTPLHKTKDKTEKKILYFIHCIESVEKGKFCISLTKEQLQYLHDSDNKYLNKIYELVLYKSIVNDIKISYVTEDISNKILRKETERLLGSLEFSGISRGIEKIQKFVNEYSKLIKFGSDIIQNIVFILFVRFILAERRLPNPYASSDMELNLSRFFESIIHLNYTKTGFICTLTEKQLCVLNHCEGLNVIYREIFKTAIENNIILAHVDYDMAIEIINNPVKSELTLQEQVKLELDYSKQIIFEGVFDEFINFIEEYGRVPNSNSKSEKEKKLGRFGQSIKQLKSAKNKFNISLSEKQLKYLCDSENKILNEIYKVILNKAIENNITIAYQDLGMTKKVSEYYDRKRQILNFGQQLHLDNEYSDVIIFNSQFSEFISFVLKNKGSLPQTNSKNEKERKLGRFRQSIKSLYNNGAKTKFNVTLTYEQLRYLYNSEYDCLKEMYCDIMYKAKVFNVENYIDMDKKIKSEIEIKERV